MESFLALLGALLPILLWVVFVAYGKRRQKLREKREAEAARNDEENRPWVEEMNLFEQKRKKKLAKKHEEELAQLKSIFHDDPSAYFGYVLDEELNYHIYDEVLGDNHNCSPEVISDFREGILGVNSILPNKNEVSKVKEVYYLKNGEERERLYSEREFAKIYEDKLYLLALKSIDAIFSSDDEQLLTGVLYNGIIQDYSPTIGKLERKTILSVFVKKEQFEGIDLDHVDPKACFKALKGVSAAKLIDITPVNPVLVLDKNDQRFIEGREITTHSGTNLASMDWQEFEQLVRQVLEMEFGKNGGEVKVTQASRDGGVDAVIFDPDPLRGGKIIVQAKRYTNTVPVSAVRDLYGTLINEGASSGILITTSDYGPDSYDFAKDKPLKLLNSGHLLALLQKNGMQGYIDLEEARHLLKE